MQVEQYNKNEIGFDIVSVHAEMLQFEDERIYDDEVDSVDFYTTHDILHTILMDSVSKFEGFSELTRLFALPICQGNEFIELFLTCLQTSELRTEMQSSKYEMALAINTFITHIISIDTEGQSLKKSIENFVDYTYLVEDGSGVNKSNLVDKIFTTFINDINSCSLEFSKFFVANLVNFTNNAFTIESQLNELDKLRLWHTSQYRMLGQTNEHSNTFRTTTALALREGKIDLLGQIFGAFKKDQWDYLNKVIDEL